MAKIVRFDHVGGPEVLQFKEEPSRPPGKGEARLKVKAVGLNRAELMFMRGQYVEDPKFPAGLGYEAAGVVEPVGPDVDKNWLAKSVAVTSLLNERIRHARAKKQSFRSRLSANIRRTCPRRKAQQSGCSM